MKRALLTRAVYCYTVLSIFGSSLNVFVFCHDDLFVHGPNVNIARSPPLSLYKCLDKISEIGENELTIPESLWVHVNEKTLGKWSTIFGQNFYRFRLVPQAQKLSCQKAAEQINIPLWENSHSHRFNALGFFVSDSRWFFHPENFCISSLTRNQLQLRVCRSSSSPDQAAQNGKNRPVRLPTPPLLRKCCPGGAILKLEGNKAKCVASINFPWIPQFYDALSNVYPNYKTVGFPSCDRHVNIIPRDFFRQSGDLKYSDQNFVHANIKISKTGLVEYTDLRQNFTDTGITDEEFCMDGIYDESKDSSLTRSSPVDPLKFMIVRCHPILTLGAREAGCDQPAPQDRRTAVVECIANSNCLRNQTCSHQKCVDPCPETCAENAACHVFDHSPICLSPYCKIATNFEGIPVCEPGYPLTRELAQKYDLKCLQGQKVYVEPEILQLFPELAADLWPVYSHQQNKIYSVNQQPTSQYTSDGVEDDY